MCAGTATSRIQPRVELRELEQTQLRVAADEELRAAQILASRLEEQCATNHKVRDKAISEAEDLHASMGELEFQLSAKPKRVSQLEVTRGENQAALEKQEDARKQCTAKLRSLRDCVEGDLTCMACLRVLSEPVSQLACGHSRCR